MNLGMQFREKLGVTQEEAAEMLGVSQPTISRWESGGEIPGPARTAMRLIMRWPKTVARPSPSPKSRGAK